jgi:phage-related protein
MALPTFTPPRAPSPGTLRKPKLSLLRAEFGDGYTQTSRAGLNHIRRTLSLTWEYLTPTQAKAITDFLEARGGDQPFYYTPSDESAAVKWTCADWSDRAGKVGYRTISAEFEQSFTLEA